MTFEKILDGLVLNTINIKDAYNEIISNDKKKRINYYLHFNDIAKEPLSDEQLQELNSIVKILQILYNSDLNSPISDTNYDTLQEILIDMGIPRLTGSIEINSSNKVHHKYTKLRGTLDKIYYLTRDEKRINKSRKYLDEWIKSAETLYRVNTGNDIDLNKVKIMLQPKFDGGSCILEIGSSMKWITRGDTGANLASDVSHIMNVFNDLYSDEPVGTGIKFEVMVSEDNKDKINQLYSSKPYKNSRQIVTSVINSKEPDFKVDYLYPIPLRIIKDNYTSEVIHPDLISKFPTEVCTFEDRDIIREFANKNRYVIHNGMRFRTDGVVLTILNESIKSALGRDNNINNFEVAYKFTEEYAYTKVRDVEFDTSNFGYICPVLIVNDVILKGNRIRRITLSNKERFDELDLSYGDEVKILYDIIPYVTIDERCHKIKNGRKIDFVKRCPSCNEILNIDTVEVRCTNPECPSKLIGKIQNYCDKLRIKNIGYSTIKSLSDAGLLKHGIKSLYKLKKHKYEISEIEGFGITKANKIVSEIESKRILYDYVFFGAIGIDDMSIKTFELLFNHIELDEFMNLIKLKNFSLLKAKLTAINGIGDIMASSLINALSDKNIIKEINSILKEVVLRQSYGINNYQNGRITFTGCRPSDELTNVIKDHKMNVSSSWSDKLTKILVVPNMEYNSNKVAMANRKKIPIIPINEISNVIDKLI